MRSVAFLHVYECTMIHVHINETRTRRVNKQTNKPHSTSRGLFREFCSSHIHFWDWLLRQLSMRPLRSQSSLYRRCQKDGNDSIGDAEGYRNETWSEKRGSTTTERTAKQRGPPKKRGERMKVNFRGSIDSVLAKKKEKKEKKSRSRRLRTISWKNRSPIKSIAPISAKLYLFVRKLIIELIAPYIMWYLDRIKIILLEYFLCNFVSVFYLAFHRSCLAEKFAILYKKRCNFFENFKRQYYRNREKTDKVCILLHKNWTREKFR